MIKDLWALRLQLLKSKTDATSEEDTLFSSQPQSKTDATPSEDTLFSSQPQSEMETDDEHEGITRKWKVRGKEMPRLIETLGLCYLGLILLRQPVSIGEMHRCVARCLSFQMGFY